jgi:hypothetical protein
MKWVYLPTRRCAYLTLGTRVTPKLFDKGGAAADAYEPEFRKMAGSKHSSALFHQDAKGVLCVWLVPHKHVPKGFKP